MKRFHANKARSASAFKKNVGKTKSANVAPPPNRGGYRF